MKTKHADEHEVIGILKLPKAEQRKGMALLRNKGIQQRILDSGEAQAIKEASTTDTVICQNCLGTYAATSFYRHRLHCKGRAIPTTIRHVYLTEDADYADLIRSFVDDEAGSICKTDQDLISIGRILFRKDKTKVEKTDEVRKSVMSDMRLLARLYISLKRRVPLANGISSIFVKANWDSLVDSIEELTLNEDTGRLKYGLKNSLYYVLLKAAEILEGKALTKESDEAATYSAFKVILKHHQNLVFSDAKYHINQSRQERLRLPERLPDQEDLAKLRKLNLETIAKLSEDMETAAENYPQLRDALVCRLTLFNARRGGEAARMHVKDWLERHRWFSSANIEKLKSSSLKDLQLVYVTGKGTHKVSIMVPVDCIRGLDLLANEEFRCMIGAHVQSPYLFARGKGCHHVVGSDAVSRCCERSSLPPDLVNATQQRANISTIYAQLDIPEADRLLFFKHMGHSAEVNTGTYQRPLPVLALEKVGRVLTTLDGNFYSWGKCPCNSISLIYR